MALSSKVISRCFDMIIKITPDKEKAKSMLGLVKDREKFVSTIDIKEFPTIATENYYEIIKELATALLVLDGFKSIGENAHKDLIDYLSNYQELSEDEVFLMNDLRIKRNKSSYEGKRIDKEYLQNKKEKLLVIMGKLIELIENRL